MTESAILHDILVAFGDRPDLRIWRQNTGAGNFGTRAAPRYVRFGTPGCADILGILRGGRFLAIEVKAPHGRLTPAQESFRAMVESFGGLYVVARCVGDVERALAKHLTPKNWWCGTCSR